ncbi:unnamed protein product [Brassica oleracea]
MGEAREDGVEDTSGSDGGHGKTPAGSGNNLEIIPPENEDTGKDDSSAPPSPADGSEPTSMDVELPPHSFPSKDAMLPDDKAGSPMVEPNPTFPNAPLGGPHVLISTEEGQTTGNPNPSEVVEKRTSKRLRTLSVPFSPPQPQPKKAEGKGGRKKTGKHEIRQLKAANAKLIREGNCVQHTEVAAGENVATVDANKKVEVELIKAAEREKMLRHCLTISWAGFIIATAIIASRCLK